MAVAAGSPSREPSAVELRVTWEVAEPPEAVASLEAEATVIMAKARHRAMARANSRFIFFIQYILLFIIRINCVTPGPSG